MPCIFDRCGANGDTDAKAVALDLLNDVAGPLVMTSTTTMLVAMVVEKM